MQRRKDINHLSADELADYVHALEILRSRSAANPDDETGYDFQAALHNDHEVGPCEHGNDLFFPWHRAHLYYFERLLQEGDPPRTSNVTIPYWDWLHAETGNDKFPAAFYTTGLSDRRDETPEPLIPDTLNIVLNTPDQEQFAGYPKGTVGKDYGDFESRPHNLMHGEYIGGRMADPATAAEDSIYFSFHAFIDLLWAEWQKRFGDPELTSPGAMLRGFEGQAMNTAGQFRRTIDLGFEYELSSRLAELFDTLPPAQEPLQLLWTGKLRPLFPGALRSKLSDSSSADFALPADALSGKRVNVHLDALKIPKQGSYTLYAYVHPNDVDLRLGSPEAQRFYVGYVALWRAHVGALGDHGGHRGVHARHKPTPHHPSAANVRFDITKAIEGQSLADMVMTLHYVPAPNRDGQPHTPDALVDEVRLSDVELEVLG